MRELFNPSSGTPRASSFFVDRRLFPTKPAGPLGHFRNSPETPFGRMAAFRRLAPCPLRIASETLGPYSATFGKLRLSPRAPSLNSPSPGVSRKAGQNFLADRHPGGAWIFSKGELCWRRDLPAKPLVPLELPFLFPPLHCALRPRAPFPPAPFTAVTLYATLLFCCQGPP